MMSRRGTYVGLDVEILEVERVLPDVDADDGDIRQERVLVGSGGDLEDLQGGVVALSHTKTDNWYASMEDRTGRVLTSQPQPEPWMEAVVALNSAMNLSTEPQVLTMASLRGPSRRTPPLPLPSDEAPARFFQKREWLM